MILWSNGLSLGLQETYPFLSILPCYLGSKRRCDSSINGVSSPRRFRLKLGIELWVENPGLCPAILGRKVLAWFVLFVPPGLVG